MARKVSVTNLGLGPRGWPESGERQPTILKRGETKTLTVDDVIFQTLERQAQGDKPEIELEVLGEVDSKATRSAALSAVSAIASAASAGRAPLLDASAFEAKLKETQAKYETAAEKLERVQVATAEKDETILRQAEEIARLTEGSEPKEYTVGPFVERALAAAGLENLADIQAALDAIEAAFEPFAKFDPDGDGKPGGVAQQAAAPNSGENGQSGDEKPGNTGSDGGAERDHFDDMDDDQLRAFIKAQTQKDPHPNAKRETLLKKAREADEGEAV